MDFKSMLQQLSQLSEGTQETEKGRVHKAEPGGYGRKFDTDEEGDEKKDDKKKAEPAVKRGRGRPKKGADSETGQVAKYDNAKGLQDFMVGNLPKDKKGKPTLPGKPGKKHSIKEWIQEIENKYVAENAPGQQLTVRPMPGAAQLVDPATQKVMATGDAAAIKNVQGAVAQGKVQMRGDVDESMDEGVHTRLNTYRIKGQDLIDQLSIQDGAEVEMVGDDVAILVVDTITFPELASMASKLAQQGKIKAIAGHATRDLTGKAVPVGRKYVSAPSPRDPKPMAESDEDYSAKKAHAGKDIGKPGKQFATIAKGAAKKYGSEESGKKVAGAVLAKLRKKVSEADIPSDQSDMGAGLGAGRNPKTFESKKPDFPDIDDDGNTKEPISKAAKDAEKKPKKKVSESVHKHNAARLLGKHHALAKEAYNCKYDDMEEARLYHEGYKEGLDECYGQMPVQGLVSENPMPATTPGMASAADKQAQANGDFFDYTDAIRRPSGASVDRDAAVSQKRMTGILGKARSGLSGMYEDDVEEGNAFTRFLATHDKGETGTVGGRTVTDTSSYDAEVDESFMAFESWDKELNALLNEGMTVSISKGQQGMPDSVSVSAQDAEADQLLGLIKQAGMGLFGGEDKPQGFAADVTGMSAGGEEEGRDSDDIGVVDDHDGMMALIKKVVGGHQEPEEVGAGSDEGHDYEGEDSDEEHDHEGHDHDDEEVNEAQCNECGMMESKCECESEQVEEVQSYDQEEYVVAEDNAPDSDEAETTADENAEAAEDSALAKADELKEWANEAGKKGTDESFETDINFITRVLAGGLNKEKSTGQTTVPVIAGQNDRMGYSVKNESISDWKKLAGLK